MNDTLLRAVEAYGGVDLWRNARTVHATVSASGLAFKMKKRPAFQEARISCDVHRPFSRLTPIGTRLEVSGILDGQSVRLETPTKEVIETREKPVDLFPGGGRFFCWDDLDMSYFANYAFWNYLTLPALLMNQEIDWQEVSPGHLRANFPGHIPTHCPQQDFHFDISSGLLKRHDYTALVIGKWAKAANRVLSHDTNNGIAYPSRRLVTPKGLFGTVLPGPVLIDITVHEFSIE